MTLKADEDKTFRGANIGSMSIHWGQAKPADDCCVPGYHMVWPRDLYQVAAALLAAGDVDAANRTLDYLFTVQQRNDDGSFPQNTWLDGRPEFKSTQLDEVAFPIILAWQLGRNDPTMWKRVRLSQDDQRIADSLGVLDGHIRVETPNGAMFRRYNHDGYGETSMGRPYPETEAGVGRLWPLLTGERGEYELANGRSADQHLMTMAGAANDGYMIPEQVWGESDQHGFAKGEGTGSATPLAWSMAQFVRLAVSIDKGRPVETPAVVVDRFKNR